MSRIIFLYSISFLLSVALLSCKTQRGTRGKIGSQKEESILKNITEPQIPGFSLNVKEFGAAGDSLADDKPAFDKAIQFLKEKGGGKIIVPAGNYLLKGPIHFISKMNLHLDKGACLLFDSNPVNYLPVVATSWEGTFLFNYSPFLYAKACRNIAITGEGTIDGEASGTWSRWYSKQEKDQLSSREMNHRKVPVEQRLFGPGHFLRPQLIQFFDCQNVKIEGVKIEDSPFWCVHLLRCENVIVSGVRFDAQNRNNDGIDPEYSRNVLIEDIEFNNSDDNIAIKAGRDNDGWDSRVRSENMVVRNCHFKGLHAVVVGSEMSAGVQNVFVHDCDFAGKLKRGVFLKSNSDRGGFIKNIFLRNVSFGEVEDCFYITSFYKSEGAGHVTAISDIFFENITCKKATGSGIVIQGFPGKKVSNVVFTNVIIDAARNAVSMTDTEGIVVNNLVIGDMAVAPTSVK